MADFGGGVASFGTSFLDAFNKASDRELLQAIRSGTLDVQQRTIALSELKNRQKQESRTEIGEEIKGLSGLLGGDQQVPAPQQDLQQILADQFDPRSVDPLGISGVAAGQTGAQSLQFGTPPPDLLPAVTPRSQQSQEQVIRSLGRLQALDPTGKSVDVGLKLLKLRDTRLLENEKKLMDRNFKESSNLLRIKDTQAQERAIIQTINDRAKEGLPSPALERILTLPPERRVVGLERRKATNTDVKLLIENQQKELERQSKEGIEAAKLRAKPLEERVINVEGGLQQRQRINPTTRLFENVGTPFDPTVKSAAKIAEEKEAIKFKGTEDFLNASLLEEKKLAIKETSKTGILKRKKLESEIREIGLNEKKKEFRRQSKIAKADLVLGKIAEAKKFIEENWFVTGFMGGMLQAVGGTDARNLRGMIDTIKANIGFAELQAMRDASPTGGALGQVAVQEINFLQSTIAALDQAQDDDILLQNLEQVADSMRRIKQIQLEAVGGGTGITLETTPTAQQKVRVKF